jgi:hypothetical protein
MSVFTLDKEHPLTKARLRFVHVLEEVELDLKPGDVVFEFPYGRIVDNGMACRRERIIPLGVEIMTVHKEAISARASCNKQGQEGKHITAKLVRPPAPRAGASHQPKPRLTAGTSQLCSSTPTTLPTNRASQNGRPAFPIKSGVCTQAPNKNTTG